MSRDPAPAERRAADLHRAARAANEDMRPGDAVALLRRGLSALDAAPATQTGRTLRGRMIVTLAFTVAELGDAHQGHALLDDAERLLDGEDLGVLHAQRALLLRRAGRDADSLPHYAAALRLIDPAVSPLLVAKVLLNRAVVHTAAGRVAQARADLRRCAELAARAGDGVVAAKASHNLGFAEWVAGDLPEALHHYERTEQLYRQVLPGNLAMLSLDRARVLLAAGLHTEADAELRASVPGLRRQRSGQDHAEGLLAMAEVALLAGRPAEAARCARRASALFARRGNDRWAGRAALLEVQAALERRGGSRVAVARRSDEVRAALAGAGLPADARVAALVSARAHLAAGDTDACRRLLAASGRPTSGDVRVHSLLVRSELASREARHRDAQRHGRAVLAELDVLRGTMGALDMRAGTAVLGTRAAEAGLARAVAAGSASGIFTWAELTRAQSLQVPPVRPDTGDADWQQLRALTIAHLRAELNGTDPADLRRRRDELRRTVQRRTWSLAGTGRAQGPVRLPALRECLGDACLVAFLRLGGRLHALGLTRDRHVFADLGPLAVARERLLRLRADLDVLAGRQPGDPLRAIVAAALDADAAALSTQLLEPLMPLVGDRELVVVPTADLVTLPWPVLPGVRGRPVTVTPSATLWARRVEAGPRTVRSLLAASGPRLPLADAEVRRVGELARGAGVPSTELRGATSGDVRRALAGQDVVHLACHGHHVTDNPLFSGLEFADGLLMGYDLLTVPQPPRAVVLSACDLGVSDVRPGDESLGIATALLAAGTRTVIASVAHTGDEATSTIMARLHAGMLAGQPPASALAAAVTDQPSGFVCLGAG